MNDIKNKYRHEMKYIVSSAEIALLKTRADILLSHDENAGSNGMYNIRSVYFDDYDNRCYYENENGTDPREKFRIRIYNHSDERIRLECKRKEHGKTLKTSCALTREQTEILLTGRSLKNISDQPPVLRKLTLAMECRQMHPAVIVEYNRTPYIYRDGNVRITFDTDISSSADIKDFFNPKLKKRLIMPAGQQIMEVKYDEFLPDYIHSGMQLENLRQTAFSKYYLCRKYSL